MPDRQYVPSRAELNQLWPIMRAHAVKRLMRRSKITEQADDFVQTAFERSLISRNHNIRKQTYEEFMKGVIDSVISHYFESWGHTSIVIGNDEALQNFSDNVSTPENEVAYLMEINAILKYIGSRSKIVEKLAIFKLKHDIYHPKKLSELMKISVDHVYDLDERMRSIVIEYQSIGRKNVQFKKLIQIRGRE